MKLSIDGWFEQIVVWGLMMASIMILYDYSRHTCLKIHVCYSSRGRYDWNEWRQPKGRYIGRPLPNGCQKLIDHYDFIKMNNVMLSEKGKLMVIKNHYKFSFHKYLKRGIERWRCSNHNCKAYFKIGKTIIYIFY